MIKLYKKYRELIVYIIVGGLTTVVYFVARFMMKSISSSATFNVAIAQFIAIVFAFVTNKFIVFKNDTKELRELAKQFVYFFVARLFVFFLDLGITFFCVDMYAGFFINLFRFNRIDYTRGIFGWPVTRSYIGSEVLLNEFLFALLVQVIAIIANYVFSKYIVFKKKDGADGQAIIANDLDK